MSPNSASSSATNSRLRSTVIIVALTIVVAFIAVLPSIVPKGASDLYWQIETGKRILATHMAPHADPYSLTRTGEHWDVPEWLSFAAFALAYQKGQFLGTWLLTAVVGIAIALVAWFGLLRCGRKIPAAFIATALMLVSLPTYIQERPTLFSLLFLAIALTTILIARAENASPQDRKLIWALPVLAIVWTNFHPGVVILSGCIMLFAAGDFIEVLLAKRNNADFSAPLNQCLRFAAVGVLCLITGCISPYGWNVYHNVLYTVSDQEAMKYVIEWKPMSSFNPQGFWAFWLLAAVSFASLIFSRAKADYGVWLVYAVLFMEAMLHSRNAQLFDVGAAILAAQHIENVLERMPLWKKVSVKPASVLLGSAVVLVFAVAFAVSAWHYLSIRLPSTASTPEAFAESIIQLPDEPIQACDFMEKEGFPTTLRVFNNYDIGGYLIFRRPQEKVFMDGRNDIYIGEPLHDYLQISSANTPDDCRDTLYKYNFDCVVTTAGVDANAFGMDPNWQVVYADPSYFQSPTKDRAIILLRRGAGNDDLIGRCMNDTPWLRQ